MFKRKGGGVKGLLNNVKKTALFSHVGFPKRKWGKLLRFVPAWWKRSQTTRRWVTNDGHPSSFYPSFVRKVVEKYFSKKMYSSVQRRSRSRWMKNTARWEPGRSNILTLKLSPSLSFENQGGCRGKFCRGHDLRPGLSLLFLFSRHSWLSCLEMLAFVSFHKYPRAEWFQQ